MHESGEAIANLAVGAAKLNAEVSDDTVAIELFQKRTSLFGMGIEIGRRSPTRSANISSIRGLVKRAMLSVVIATPTGEASSMR